jgi:hypothetical protein
MGDTEPRIRMGGLTRLELLELTDALPEGQTEGQLQETLEGGMHGDLATWQIVIQVSTSTLPVLAAWLLRRRKASKVELETESFDGQGWTRCSLRIQTAEQSPPDAAVLRQLTAMTRIPGADPGDSSAQA